MMKLWYIRNLFVRHTHTHSYIFLLLSRVLQYVPCFPHLVNDKLERTRQNAGRNVRNAYGYLLCIRQGSKLIVAHHIDYVPTPSGLGSVVINICLLLDSQWCVDIWPTLYCFLSRHTFTLQIHLLQVCASFIIKRYTYSIYILFLFKRVLQKYNNTCFQEYINFYNGLQSLYPNKYLSVYKCIK